MLKDLRYAFRMLAKSPAFALVAICSLAIGIGANSAIFSLADALLLRPLPVARPGSIVTVNPIAEGPGVSSISYPDYRDFRDRNRSFDGLVALQYAQFGYAPNARVTPEMRFGAFVSGNFFRVLGVEPALGRGFRDSEDQVPGRDAVVVLSHDFWTAQFHSSPAAIGSRMRLNGVEFTIIGVAPASFKSSDQFVKPAVYVPIAMSPKLSGADNLNKRDASWLIVKGRLKPGVTMTRAGADLTSIAKGLEQMHSSGRRDPRIRVESELSLRMEQSPADAGLVEMLLLLAACVLLVACANVAGLLLSRASARRREIAVRTALGASRWQLIRQLFLENLLLAAGGGALGVVVSLAGIRLFASIPMPADIPVSLDIGLDPRVLFFTLLVSVASTFLFGLAPAWRGSRAEVASALKTRDTEGTRRSRLWGRNVLVSTQIAVSFVLLIVAAMIFFGFRGRLRQGPGIETDHLLIAELDTHMAHYSGERSTQFYRRLLDGARSEPGIRTAALTSSVPFGFNGDVKPVIPEGFTLARGEKPPDAFDSVVSDGYFETYHIPILRGRGFLESDKADSPRIAVVNEHFAHRFWPNQDPVGKRFHLESASGPLVQVVGVARQAKYNWIGEPPLDFVYLPFSQNLQSDMSLIAESSRGDGSDLAPVVRRLVYGIDPDMPVFGVITMREMFRERCIQTPNIIIAAVGSMGVMAFLLAVIGLYGLIAYSVSRRTREIGIRMAVGATSRSVLEMVLRQGLVLALYGAGAGLFLGIAASRLVGSTFITSFGSAGPLLFVSVLLPLLAVALLAAYVPARRASRIDPMSALREE